MKDLPGKRRIQKALSDCRFDPKEPGPIKIICEIGNEFYYRNRAIELIKENNIKLAIQLLILAKIESEK